VSINYYAQELNWNDPELNEKGVRQQLSRWGISGKLVRQPIKTLSGGAEKIKL